ncbi:MAG: MlaD family protein [Myxococcota bacterium]|nr:MlaD family protein [Myxococcota bacterium]
MATPGVDERYLELKVGAMILVALAILVTFILILGDWSLKAKTDLDIFFQNPGGLSGGSAVKIAGRKVGTITEMTFLGQSGPRNPITGLPSLVRVRIAVEEDVQASLRRDAKFYVTTKGVLGDPFLEIDPGVSPRAIDLRTPLFGIDPPRLDLFVADAYQLLKTLNRLIERNTENLDHILGSSARLLSTVEDMVDAGSGEPGQLARIADGLSVLIADAQALVTGAKEKYIDDPKVARIVNNLASLTGKLDREIDDVLADIRNSLASIERLSSTIGPDEQAKIKAAIAKLNDTMTRADRTLGAVEAVVRRIRRGEGTVGQLMADEEIYDDLKELIRDIKRHPWKIIWQD